MSLKGSVTRKALERARGMLRQSILDTGPSRDLPALLALAAAAALSLVVLLSGIFWMVLTVLSGFHAPGAERAPALLTAAISTTALIGASLGAVYAFRKQVLTEKEGIRADQQVYSDRYIKGAELLANERPSARLAALHSLANLADDWADGRSSCAMAICSYLRLPLADTTSGGTDLGEREVRRTAWKAVRARLEDPEAESSWHGQEFDFSGGQFDNIDLDLIKLHSVRMQFRGCSFSDGEIRLRGVDLDDGVIDFSTASFKNMRILTAGMRLAGRSSVIFDAARFSDCTFESSHMAIGEDSGLYVREADICDSSFKFDHDHLWIYFTQRSSSRIDGEIAFSGSRMKAAMVSMHKYVLDGRLLFDDVVTDDVEIVLPSKIVGIYVNLDLISQGPTRVRIGPGSLESGDLRIRPGEGLPASLDVDFYDYDIVGGEILVLAKNPVWNHFRFQSARKRGGSFRVWEKWPSHAEVDITDYGRKSKDSDKE